MGARNYLIDGVSGSGKTAVCHELRRRGHHAINGDRELAYQGNPITGEPTDGVSGLAVHDHHLWRVADVETLAADAAHPVTFFCGGSRNAATFIYLFDEVFLLTVGAEVLARRLDARPSDEWGGRGRTEERALIRHLHQTGEGLPPNATRIDAERPLADVVDTIVRRVGLGR